MRIRSRLGRLENTLRSRSEITTVRQEIQATRENGTFVAEVQFFDGSRLFVTDNFRKTEDGQILRKKYIFHYQHADGSLIFRYDNAPHYPDLPTFPAHKHTPDGVMPSPAPDLADVLREIDEHLYPDRQS